MNPDKFVVSAFKPWEIEEHPNIVKGASTLKISNGTTNITQSKAREILSRHHALVKF
ncbi:hypothetical protein GCM10007966_05510 [Legionella impletisoli]|uniref:Uncharacterized protein n=1 Tax=Legionella impletisoli TaxID=343510 RepID=A0A917JRA2_9GAMM|nr:hypothetical protein GCM10007966_05510 [Legionella impletisoli]